ncbi:MAG: MarR family transcriptional regulator [Actinomycetales bacterium]|nr:MarR family transcriptional regulator [Actinomycetales bacterium]
MSTTQDAPVTTETRWLDAQQQVHWRAFLTGSAIVTAALSAQLEAEAGMSLSEYEILVRLSESEDHTLRMSQLADGLVHSRSRLTHTVRRMEDRGLVERMACEGDGRGVNCHMTAHGYEALVAAAPGHVEAVRRILVDPLTDVQFAALGEAMAAVSQSFEEK